ncbi:MAG: uridine kinase [Bacteroidota bacterium]|nr:uridine kinase [Bacteroidota bacterium]
MTDIALSLCGWTKLFAVQNILAYILTNLAEESILKSPSGQHLVIGIAGGTGSGKTTVTQRILDRLHVQQDNVVVTQHDSYYKDLSAHHGLPPDKINFDHPDSLETSLLIQHIKDLRNGKAVEQPIYNFTTHSRLKTTKHLEPKDIIIIEGILILVDKELRDLMDIKIFLDTDADERVLRRLRRDTVERGRSIESVMNQYISTVKPMHLEFVEPSKHWADIIIPRGGENAVAIDMVVAKIESMLRNKHTIS